MRLVLNHHILPYYDEDLPRVWQAASNQTQTELFWGPDDNFAGYNFNWGNNMPLEVLYVGGGVQSSTNKYWHMVATFEDEAMPAVVFLFVRDEPPYNDDAAPEKAWRLAPKAVSLDEEETRVWRRYPGGDLPSHEVTQAAESKAKLVRRAVAMA